MIKEKEHVDVLKLFENKDVVKVAAPMVRYSKLQFRTLLRNYQCDLCYTPMILADSFNLSVKARKNEFTTNLYDTPLITQFAANDVNHFVNASKIVAPYCDGVDLNCGCPQTWAKQMGVGCIMLQKPEIIYDIVRQCRNQILKPFSVSVKMRVLKNLKATIEICRRLDKCGVTYLTIHGRTPTQLTGDVDANNFKLITETVDCPIVANGGVKTLEDCHELQKLTNCKGIMVANGLLTNPMLFSGVGKTNVECIQAWVDICFNSTLSDYEYTNKLSQKQNAIPEKPPYLTFQCFHHHLVFMLEKILPKSKRRIFNNLQNFSDALTFLYDEFGMEPKLFDMETFNNYRSLPLWTVDSTANEINDYDYEVNSGKYFFSKVNKIDEHEDEYGIENIFVEN